MPFNGSGTFIPAITFVDDTPATAEDQNTQDLDLADGLTNCMTRDGQAPATDNLSMGGFQLKQVAAGTVTTDAANVSQINGVLAAGLIMPYAGPNIPSKWLLCYGQAVSRTTYAALFLALDTIWGIGNGSTTFNLPDFRGRILAGVDNMGGVAANRITVGACGIAGDTLSANGGDQALALHTHVVTDPGHDHGVTDPAHSHLYTRPNYTSSGAGGGGNWSDSSSAVQTGNASTGVTINSNTTGITLVNAGSGASANVQPTAMINWLIYTGVA